MRYSSRTIPFTILSNLLAAALNEYILLYIKFFRRDVAHFS